MRKAYIPFGVHNTTQRHAPQLEQVDLLPVLHGNRMRRIRETYKRNLFILPILTKYPCRVRPYSQNFGTAAGKLLVSIP